MVSLEGFNTEVGVLLDSLDTLGACLCSCHSCDIRNSVLYRCLADIAVVVSAALSGRGIDYKLYLAVCDLVGNIRSALVDLEYLLYGYAVVLYHLEGLACCKDAEAQVIEGTGDIEKLGLVAVVDAEKHCSLLRQSCLSSFLSLVVSLAEAGRYSEHLAGGTHLWSEDGIDFLEHIEGEHGFLNAVVADLLRAGTGEGLPVISEVMISVAIFTILMLHTLDTSGTVLEARGLASST